VRVRREWQKWPEAHRDDAVALGGEGAAVGGEGAATIMVASRRRAMGGQDAVVSSRGDVTR
jgi:hypothetical protein